MKILKSGLYLVIIVTIITNCGNSNTPIENEPHDIIASWQMDPEFSNDGEYIVFKGLYDSSYAVHFIDKNGDYIGGIIKDKLLSSPSWGPDNKKIVVSIDGNISITNINGDGITQLTTTGQDFSPSWSNDGKFIAYTKSICDPECGIALYDLKNSSTKLIAKYGSYASWNKISDKLYYYHTMYVKRTDSYISDYKGFVFKRIEINTFKVDSLFYISDTNLWLEDCTISPDEKEILFAASEGAPPQIYIWKVDLEQNTLYKITVGNHPTYSPDGSTIVYTNTNITEGGLWIMNRDGSNRRQLTKLNK